MITSFIPQNRAAGDTPTNALTPVSKDSSLPTARRLSDADFPAAIKAAGPFSGFAYEEFIFAKIRNAHTRRASTHVVNCFLEWIHKHKLPLQEIRPRDIRDYFDSPKLAIPSKMLHRPALDHFFDYQVNRHAVVLNPVNSFRNERYEVEEGKTPEIWVKQAKHLFRSIDVATVGCTQGPSNPRYLGLFRLKCYGPNWYRRNGFTGIVGNSATCRTAVGFCPPITTHGS